MSVCVSNVALVLGRKSNFPIIDRPAPRGHRSHTITVSTDDCRHYQFLKITMINIQLLKIIMAAVLFGFAALGFPVATALGQNKAPKYELNPKLLNLPKEKWIKIHHQSFSDPVWFIRQQHGGSTFDTRRGRLVLFGSDTHGKNWLNTPLFFDLNTLEWHRLYRSDSLPSYRVTLNGLPVAGPKGDHPWAMHTFGAVTYDPNADAIVVASYPAHMVPGRFTGALAKIWSHVKTHPTWILELGKGRWQPLASTPVHFFPYATAFDTRRGVVLGYRNDGVYELSLARGHWQQVAKGGLLEWGNNAVFDSQNNVLVVYGSHKKRNDIVVFEIATGRHRIMPTSGPRPSGGNYVPMAFHAGIGKTAAIIDQRSTNNAPSSRASWAETWLYDYAGDAWTHVKKADLPFNVGMNYNLEFDPRHQLLLLVVEPPDRPLPAIWALSLGNNSQSNLSLRRAEPLALSPASKSTNIIRQGKLKLHLDRKTIFWNDVPVPVTPIEFKLVRLMSDRANEVVSSEEISAFILSIASDSDAKVAPRKVILNLRQKFRGVDSGFIAIEFLPGQGFRWRH